MKQLILHIFTGTKANRVLAAIFMVAVFSSHSIAQEKHFVLNNTHIIEMTNELTGRTHELVICLPSSYESSPDKNYPVLVYADAYWDTPLLNSIHGNLVYDNVIPELIMVGLSYPDDANYDQLRARDLTPSPGDADKFLEFIENVVIPKIDSEYRIDKNNMAVSGNSLGGLFSLYTIYKKPNLFKRAIAISPAVGYNSNYLSSVDEKYSAENDSLSARCLISYGGDEYKPFRNQIINFQEKIKARNYKGFELLNYKIEGERHTGVKGEGYSRGLRWVFKDMAPKGPSGLARGYGE